MFLGSSCTQAGSVLHDEAVRAHVRGEAASPLQSPESRGHESGARCPLPRGVEAEGWALLKTSHPCLRTVPWLCRDLALGAMLPLPAPVGGGHG